MAMAMAAGMLMVLMVLMVMLHLNADLFCLRIRVNVFVVDWNVPTLQEFREYENASWTNSFLQPSCAFHGVLEMVESEPNADDVEVEVCRFGEFWIDRIGEEVPYHSRHCFFCLANLLDPLVEVFHHGSRQVDP